MLAAQEHVTLRWSPRVGGRLASSQVAARERIARDLHEHLDDRTKRERQGMAPVIPILRLPSLHAAGIVEEYGGLQDAMFVLADQAAALDGQYRHMSTERNQYKASAQAVRHTSV